MKAVWLTWRCARVKKFRHVEVSKKRDLHDQLYLLTVYCPKANTRARFCNIKNFCILVHIIFMWFKGCSQYIPNISLYFINHLDFIMNTQHLIWVWISVEIYKQIRWKSISNGLKESAAGYNSRYSDCPWAGRSGDRIQVGGEIFRTCPDWPWGPPSLLYNGYQVFPGGKVWPGRDADLSPPSSAEVKNRVEPYLYSP